jgi:uncharacterized protein
MNIRWAARQRAQQDLPKSLRLYSGEPASAIDRLMQHPAPASVVIDTNVVLDWLVFGNADAAELAGFITSGRLRWLTTHDMRVEVEHVLTRDTLRRWTPQRDRVLGTWDEWSQAVPAPVPIVAHGVHCSDPDDQKFIDLAIGMRSSCLFTRDRSLLRLARKARRLGVEVLTPRLWLLAARERTQKGRPQPPRKP